MPKYDRNEIALLAATQLQNYDHSSSAEPHHVRAAVATAMMIVDVVAEELAKIDQPSAEAA